MGFYSKNKLNKLEELTKIEQKRYQELLANSRVSNRNIISNIRASFSKGKVSLTAEERKEAESLEFKPVTPEAYLEHSLEVQLKDMKLIGTKHGEAKQRKMLPNLKKTPKKQKIKQADEFRSQLAEIEQQEKVIQKDIDIIDFNHFKQRFFDSLQAISEDYREMEESLKSYKFQQSPQKVSGVLRAKVYEMPIESIQPKKSKNKDISIRPRNNLTEVKIKPGVLADSDFIKEERFDGKKRYNKYIKKGFKEQSVPDRRSNVDSMRSSYYSDYSIQGDSVDSLSRDYVRVSPNVDVRKLLYS